MATVYLWRPSLTSENKRVGHLSLCLDDSEETYISFWPASGGKGALTGCTAKFQTYEEDVEAEGDSPDESYFIPGEFLSLEKIRSWFYENKTKYSLFSNNCARTVYLALQAGGLKLFKANLWLTTGMFIRFPDDDDPTYEEIQQRNEVMARGGIEDLPVQPVTAYSWIKDKVEELKGKRTATCVCM